MPSVIIYSLATIASMYFIVWLIAKFQFGYSIKSEIKESYREAERKALDKSWSTAREPNPDSFHFQDNFLVQLIKKIKKSWNIK